MTKRPDAVSVRLDRDSDGNWWGSVSPAAFQISTVRDTDDGGVVIVIDWKALADGEEQPR